MVESDDSEFVGELIRCKDCQNFKQMPIDRHGHQPYWCENLNIYSEGPDWFCADGKHKKVSKVEMKEYYDWDDGCYEKVIHYEPDKKGWRYGAKKSRITKHSIVDSNTYCYFTCYLRDKCCGSSLPSFIFRGKCLWINVKEGSVK